MKLNLALKLYLTALLFALWQCATVTTPMGGPKDEKPPELIKSNPKQKELNFKGKTVELTFNEDMKLKDAKEEIIITPSPGKDVDIIALGRVLSITPKNGWAENTTFNISFREGVQDITEGNPAEDLKLAFSTGPVIDSLSISGSIKDALIEKIPEKITIAIYSSDTFDIFKHTPIYFTKSNKTGNFKIENLKTGTYFIYAFEDKNKNLKIESQNEQFGFLSNAIVLNKNQAKLSIPLIKLDTRKLKVTKPRATDNITFIKFSKNIINYRITTKEKILNSFGDDQTEIKLILPEIEKDSIQIHLEAQDSLSQKIDTTLFVKKGTNKKQEEKLSVEISEPKLEEETGDFMFSITANKLIKEINTDSIILELDSLERITFPPSDYKWDTIRKKIELSKTIDKKKINAKNKITLIAGKDFLKTFENDSIKKKVTKTVKLISTEETGNLSVEVKTTSEENFIIQLLTQDNKVIQSAINQKKHVFKYLDPTVYKIRIVIDRNKNNKWDVGNIFQKIEPEKTIYFINREKKYEIPMRANWEQEITISF